MIRLERVIGALPAGFETMRLEARSEGHSMLDTLAVEWEAGQNRFDREGEALFAAFIDDDLAGIGGLTIEASLPKAMRMRRFYVRPTFRRVGVGQTLAAALLREISPGQTVTANAAAGSETFWETLDFVPDRCDGHTHVRR